MRKADNLTPSCAVVMKSGNLNILEPSGPLQACNGIALRFSPVQTPYKRSDIHHKLQQLVSQTAYHPISRAWPSRIIEAASDRPAFCES